MSKLLLQFLKVCLNRYSWGAGKVGSECGCYSFVQVLIYLVLTICNKTSDIVHFYLRPILGLYPPDQVLLELLWVQ